MTRLPRLAAVALVLLAVASCGTETFRTEPGTTGATEAGTADTTASTSPTASPSPTGGPSAPAAPAAAPSRKPGKTFPGGPGDAVPPAPTRLSGRLSSGVEAGCVLLESGGQVYLLLGSAVEELTPGSDVVVEGRPQPDAMTTCQQGTPFLVSSLTPS